MAVVQSVYNSDYAVGFPGMVVNGEAFNKISRTFSEAVDFGQPAYRSGDHGAVAGGTQAGTAESTPAAGNAGNGAMGSVTVSAGAEQGRYVLTIIEPAADAGEFQLEDPDGSVIGNGTVAVAFSGGGLAFTLADGSNNFAAGDQIFIDVTFTENADFLGLTVKDTTVPPNLTTPDQYPADYTAAIMTMGVMWVTAGASVTVGGQVYWNPATKRYTATTTHVEIPEWKYDSAGGNGDLVRVARR